jgi:hypothetical protein
MEQIHESTVVAFAASDWNLQDDETREIKPAQPG